MDCPRCRHQNAANAAFCDECGAPLESLCPGCGKPNRPGARFCRNCGRAIAPPGAADGAPSQGTDSRRAIEQILTSKAILEGERKQVSVLFADVKGSMELIADRDPEEAHTMLDPVLELMMEAVRRYEGTVSQVMGDGLMALFGAPIAQENHAIQACHAALRIQESIEQHATRLRAHHGVDVQVRIGLNSGEAVVRSLHHDLRADYSAVGQTVHLAARMEQLARPGTILMAAPMFRAVVGLVDVQSLGPVPVKGVEQPVEVYELLAARNVQTRLQTAAATGNLSRFIGREVELATLNIALARAYQGRGQIVSLVGEPGVGKSRLAHEFARSDSTQGWITLEAHAVSYGERTAYLPVVSLLHAYFDVSANDSLGEIREKVDARVEALDRRLVDVVPAILWLLGVPSEDAAWNALDAEVRRERATDALKQLLLRQSQERPLLLVFEDLHWIDRESEALLESLAEILPTSRVLLLVTYRTEYEHRWSGKTFYTQIRVDPLPPTIVEGFIEELVGTHASLDPVKRLLLERTGGNPFFLEESVRDLVDTGALIGARGAHVLASPPERIEIPRSVQAVLAARIDRLLPAEKELLQAAAVIGKDVALPVLQAVNGSTAAEIEQPLHRLQAAELLYQTKLWPAEYTFKHALTYDVAYANLLQQRRKALHAAALQAIERLYPDRLAEQVESLARHAVQGEMWEKAAGYLRQAGTAAQMRSSYRAAESWYRSAMAALEHLPPNGRTAALGIDLRLELYNALLARGDHGAIFEVLEGAERLGLSLGDERRLARTHGYLAMALWWIAEYDRALETGRQALDAARRLERHGLEGIALVAIGWTHAARGEFTAARRTMTEVLELARRNPKSFAARRGAPLLAVMALSWLAASHGEQGAFDDALAAVQEALRLAEEADHPWSRVAAYHAQGALFVRQAKLDDAIPVLERAMRLCESNEIHSWATTVAWELGHAYALAGNAVQGVSLLEQAVRQAAAERRECNQSLRIGLLGEAELLAGRPARAAERAEEALRLAQLHRERPAEAHILRILGDIAAAGDAAPARALERYRGALAIAEDLEVLPLQARCHDAIGRVLARHNDAASAADASRTPRRWSPR